VLRVRDLLVAANDPMIHNAINFVQLLCYLTCKQDGRVIVVTGLKLNRSAVARMEDLPSAYDIPRSGIGVVKITSST
jgi:hypothetical protein